MEKIYFVLGMITVLVVLGVMIVYNVKKKIEELEKEVQYLERNSHESISDLHRRMDDEVRDLENKIK